DGVVGRAKWSRVNQAGGRVQDTSHAVDLRGLQGFLEGERWKNAWNAFGQHGLARAGWTDHQDVVTAGAGNFERPLGGCMAASLRLAVNWPRTSLKSDPPLGSPLSICDASTFTGETPLPLLSRLTTSISDLTGYTLTPPTTAASRALTSGTIRLGIFLARAATAIGSAPRTPRTPPSSD